MFNAQCSVRTLNIEHWNLSIFSNHEQHLRRNQGRHGLRPGVPGRQPLDRGPGQAAAEVADLAGVALEDGRQSLRRGTARAVRGHGPFRRLAGGGLRRLVGRGRAHGYGQGRDAPHVGGHGGGDRQVLRAGLRGPPGRRFERGPGVGPEADAGQGVHEPNAGRPRRRFAGRDQCGLRQDGARRRGRQVARVYQVDGQHAQRGKDRTRTPHGPQRAAAADQPGRGQSGRLYGPGQGIGSGGERKGRQGRQAIHNRPGRLARRAHVQCLGDRRGVGSDADGFDEYHRQGFGGCP